METHYDNPQLISGMYNDGVMFTDNTALLTLDLLYYIYPLPLSINRSSMLLAGCWVGASDSQFKFQIVVVGFLWSFTLTLYMLRNDNNH